MTSLLLWKEHLKQFYSRYSFAVQAITRFVFVLTAVMSLNANIGYMAKLKSPLVILPVCLVSAFLPYGVSVFLIGCLMIAHVSAVSLEMSLIAGSLILIVAVLYFGFRPGDSYLMVLTPLAFLFRIPYAVPLLVGLGGSLASAVPVSCGVFLYYLLNYVKQNAAGLIAKDSSVDIVQKYTQILKSVLFNQTMLVMIATCALTIVVVYLIRRLSVDYAWLIAIVAGAVAEILTIFVGDFQFGVSVPMGEMILGLLLSGAVAAVFHFFVLSVDYTRTEHVQFEDDDYYYYVKAVPKMTVSTPDIKVQKISSTRKRVPREKNL